MASGKVQPGARTPLQNMTAPAVTRRWVRYNRHTHSHRTQENYKRIIWRFVHGYAPAELQDTTVEHIERYLDDILQHCSARTANSHLTAIKSFFRWLNERYDLPNPAARVKMLKESPPKQRVITHEEYQKVLAVCQNDEADVIQVLANTGLRIAELRSLTWENVDANEPPRYLSFLGKGSKLRLVPLNKTCQAILGKYKRKSNNSPMKFLESRRGRNTILFMCHRLAKAAGIPQFGPHALRHYAATRLYHKKVELSRISKVLGHASTRVTETIYIHWGLEDVIGVTDILDEK
jgi:integrase